MNTNNLVPSTRKANFPKAITTLAHPRPVIRNPQGGRVHDPLVIASDPLPAYKVKTERRGLPSMQPLLTAMYSGDSLIDVLRAEKYDVHQSPMNLQIGDALLRCKTVCQLHTALMIEGRRLRFALFQNEGDRWGLAVVEPTPDGRDYMVVKVQVCPDDMRRMFHLDWVMQLVSSHAALALHEELAYLRKRMISAA